MVMRGRYRVVSLLCLCQYVVSLQYNTQVPFHKKLIDNRMLCLKKQGERSPPLSQLMQQQDDPEWAALDCDLWLSRNEQGIQTSHYRFRYLSYPAMLQRMRALELLYPDMVRLYSAQDDFGLPSAGKCSEEEGVEKNQPCKVWVMEVGNMQARTEETPRLFFSGALHGDERIGPTALLELVSFLLGTYAVDPWARIMLDSRVLVLIPAANAVGYQESKRDELGVDPNRDFAFDTSSSRCMQSVAARSVNEVWRRNIFSLAVTFHGGDNLIAHPWGDTKHCPGYPGRCQAREGMLSSWISPDHTAMLILSKYASDFAGPLPTGRMEKFRFGPLNDPRVIYPVGGGMEDWAYGASWAPGGVNCLPS
ncbi:hypothetical protein GUITHDRAFT_165327, partial [Guillardia theta CCMP2712]